MHSADSIVGFKRRLANYFERTAAGEINDLKHIFETLPRAYTTPEAQDTLMRFISDRCGIEEAEAVEELDYVTARLERERRNERFERLLEPWTTEQLEGSLRLFFAENDPSQLSSVSALVTFYRGKEITLIRELELQYRRPLLLLRDDDDANQEANSALELAAAANLQSSGGADDRDDDGKDDEDDDRRGGKDGKDGGKSGLAGKRSGGSNSSNSGGGNKKGSGGSGGGGSNSTQALRIRTNWEELTVDSMQQFELDILQYLLEIRQELQQRVVMAQTMAQNVAVATMTPSASKDGVLDGDVANSDAAVMSPQGKAKTAAAIAAANSKAAADAKQAEELTQTVNDMSRELAALPRKRLARVERMMHIVPLIARAVTPVFKSQLLLYLGFYCSLRVEARKVMQKRLAGANLDAPLKADENFHRRVSVLVTQEKETRHELVLLERRVWSQMDPMFFRERFQRLMTTLLEEEQARREELDFDEMCISSVARAKMRSLVFLEQTHRDLNSYR